MIRNNNNCFCLKKLIIFGIKNTIEKNKKFDILYANTSINEKENNIRNPTPKNLIRTLFILL
jgi:hypothetical protein